MFVTRNDEFGPGLYREVHIRRVIGVQRMDVGFGRPLDEAGERPNVVEQGLAILWRADAVLKITKSGRTDAWITWKAAPGAHPDVRPTGWGGITITASYIVIDGINVTGDNDRLTLEDALADSKKPRANPRFNTNGITIEGRKSAPDAKPHHITIRTCVVSKCPGGGINMLTGDYCIIEDNLVFGNAWYMRYAGSGISALESWAHDDKPGYHIIIQRNLVWDNKTLVPWKRIGKLSDGNGIILDVTDGPASAGPTNPNGDAAVKPKGAAPGTAKPAAVPAVAPKPAPPCCCPNTCTC